MPYQRLSNGSSADSGPQAITTVVNSIEAGLEAVEAQLPQKASVSHVHNDTSNIAGISLLRAAVVRGSSQPPAYSGLGTTITLSAAGAATSIASSAVTSPNSTSLKYEGAVYSNVGTIGSFTNCYRQNASTLSLGTGVRGSSTGLIGNILNVSFNTDSDDIEVILRAEAAGGSKFRVWINEAVASDPTALPSQNGIYRIRIQFPSTAIKKIRIEAQEVTFCGVQVPNRRKIWKPEAIPGPVAVAVMDSFGVDDLDNMWIWNSYIVRAGRRLGWDMHPNVVSGTGFINAYWPGSVNYQSRINSDIVPANPDIVIIQASINDINGGYSAASVQLAMTNTVAALRSAFPSALLIGLGGISPVDTFYATTTTYNSYLQSVMSANSGLFVAQNEWIRGTGTAAAPNNSGNSDYYTYFDGYHLNASGYTYCAERLLDGIAVNYNRTDAGQAGIAGQNNAGLVPSTKSATPSPLKYLAQDGTWSGDSSIGVFNVREYGAKGDLREITASINASSNVVTASTSVFSAADVGKTMVLFKGGTSSANLTVTITGYTSGTQVTVSSNAVTSISSKKIIFGTDDTAAINSAINALNATRYGGVLYFPPGDYFVPGGSLTAMTKPATVRGDGRSEWYSISESVSKISTASLTGTLVNFNARSGRIENITVHNRNYSPDALLVDPGLGGFPSPLPEARVGNLPTAGCGVKANVGDGWSLSNVVVAGFYDNIDQVSGVNVIIEELQSWAPVRYGHRVRNDAWIDAGGTNITDSFYFGNPKYSTNTRAIQWESGGGMWISTTGFSGMGEAGLGQDTGMAWAVYTDFIGSSGNLYMDSCGVESASSGVYVAKAPGYGWYHTIITDFQFSPYGSKLGANTVGVYIKGDSFEPCRFVRVSGFFTNFPNQLGTGVKLEYVDSANLDIISNLDPGSQYTTSNVTNLVLQNKVATTAADGLMPKLSGSASDVLRGNGTWGSSSGTAHSGCRARQVGNQSLTVGITNNVAWDVEDYDDNSYHSTTTNNSRFTAASTGRYRLYGSVFLTGATEAYVFTTVNGVTTGASKRISNTNDSAAFDTGTLQLNSGDFVQVAVFVTSGGTVATDKNVTFAQFERMG